MPDRFSLFSFATIIVFLGDMWRDVLPEISLRINVSEYQDIWNVTRAGDAEEFPYPLLLSGLLVLCGVVAVLTNLILILTFFVKRRLKHIHNVFITNMSVNDLILGLVRSSCCFFYYL